MDEATYAKSVQYTLAKSRLGQAKDTWGLVILLAALFAVAARYSRKQEQRARLRARW